MKKAQPLFLGLVAAAAVFAAITLASITGCESGTTGVLRPISPTVEHTITNIITTITTAAPAVVPQPYAIAIEGVGAVILALLAAWQGISHQKIKLLTNGASQGSTKPPA